MYEAVISRAEGMAPLVREFARNVLGLSQVPVAALFRESEAGVSTGPHLHFELWDGDVHVDPAGAIPALSGR